MVLALAAGAALATPLGIAVGDALVKKFKFGFTQEKDDEYLRRVDMAADEDDSIPMPDTAGKPVTVFKKLVLRNTSPWLVQPDYDRVLFINTILKLLWPHLSPAIHKQVTEQSKAPIKDVCDKVKVLQEVRIDRLDLGSVPPRVDCFKSFETGEDELIIECPAFWGGDISVRATAVIKAGSKTVDFPVDVGGIQFKALTRITIKPLVETLPCLGGVNVSLMEIPHFDMDLRLADSPDLMALPGVPLAVQTAIAIIAGKMLVYPNEFSLPLMPNFGLPPPPQGMLHVKVVSARGLKSSLFDKVDPLVQLELRKGRGAKTTTKPNNEAPVWNEEFDFVVDAPKKQGLHLALCDDDLISASVEGVAVIPLDSAEFMAKPGVPVTVNVEMRTPTPEGQEERKPKSRAPTADGAGAGASGGGKGKGSAAGASCASASPDASAASGASGEKKRSLLSRLRRKKKSDAAGSTTASLAGDVSPPASAGGASPRPSIDGTPASPSAAEGAAEAEAGEEAASAPSTPRLKLPAGAPTGAVLTLEVTYMPFKTAQPEVVKPTPAPGQEAPGATDEPETAVITSVRRMLVSATGPDLESKGVLTINLKKCTNLESEMDTYAVVTLNDPHRLPIPNITYRSDVVISEDSPRYNLRRDFVNVSAASSLSVVIYEQPGMMDALKSIKIPFLQKAQPKVVGRMRVMVSDVAREGRIKDHWPLLEAQTGECHLSLDWNPVVLDRSDMPEGSQ